MATTYEVAIEKKGFDTMSKPNDVLSLQYKKYENSLYAASLAKPPDYYKASSVMNSKQSY